MNRVRSIFRRLRQSICPHRRLCSYQEWKQRPNKRDLRVWCADCGHRSPVGPDDILTESIAGTLFPETPSGR